MQPEGFLSVVTTRPHCFHNAKAYPDPLGILNSPFCFISSITDHRLTKLMLCLSSHSPLNTACLFATHEAGPDNWHSQRENEREEN